MSIPDESGISMVAYHYNINRPLPGVAAGDYNVDVNAPDANGEWAHENREVTVNVGDTIFYWYLVIKNGEGVQKTEQAYTFPAPTTTTTTTTTTTVAPTTPPSLLCDVHPDLRADCGTPGVTAQQCLDAGCCYDNTIANTKWCFEAELPTEPPTTTTTTTTTTAPPPTDPPTPGPTLPPGETNPPGTEGPEVTPDPGVECGECVGGIGSGIGGGYGGTYFPCESYPCLIFEDNFDNLDFNKWEHEITAGGGGNWEFQYYLNNRSNSYVRDGNLYLKPTLTSDRYGEAFLTSGSLDIWGTHPASQCTGEAFWGCRRQGSGSNPINPCQSARIRTVRSFILKYGRIEIEAKMPKGDWIWPAIWLLPAREEYGIWPASGEVDMVEARGNENLNHNGEQIGVNQMGSTMHWGPYWPVNGYEKTHARRNLPTGDFNSDFHKYAIEWDENEIKFFLDDEEILHVDPGPDGFWKYGEFDERVPGSESPWKNAASKMAPFDKEFYLIMNVAVGGTNGFFPDDASPAKPWNNESPTAFLDFWNARGQWYPTWKPDENNGESAAMVVNYVRAWKMKPSENAMD
ncbi:unnamed protein product [Owenia fusiformis]|nr:unnamed protein product [Owenia fusiformis]